ncbi:MAG: PepSY-associated TM helix domain-containing protein [Bacteroidales bacterium]
MNWRRINRALHRDIGYFFFGMCIIYGVSGIALNHRHQWNPNYIVKQESFNVSVPEDVQEERVLINHILDEINESGNYRTHLVSGQNMRIFIDGGTVNINLQNGSGNIETIRKRPVFHEINFLHYNTSRKLWTWFSDMFAAGLVILAVTGLFVLKGKNSFRRRGIYFVVTGILIPLLLLYLYFNS